jgi:hypothetical protein
VAYAVIAFPVGDKSTVIHKSLTEAIEWVRFLFDEGENPGPVTVEYRDLTAEQVDALPEFQGY